jgi:predicted dehydrogenase/threonine dehydrogenase-like Zn-dependent dehydrogenase
VFAESGRAELVKHQVPAPRRGEVTVEVLVSAVSPGTERAQFLRLPNARPVLPHRPGYSVAGRVLAVGRDVPFAPGDVVAVPRVPHASVATVAAQSVFAVAEGVAPADAALVYLAVIAGHALDLGEPLAGGSVCVVGAGPVGALAMRLARLRGCARVVAVGRTERRRAGALAGGVDRFLLVGADRALIADLGAPVVVEATGDPDGVGVATAAAAAGGRVVLLGSPRGRGALPAGEIRRKRLELVGAHVSTLAQQPVGTVAATAAHARAFLDALGDRKVAVADLAGPPVDPREAAAFYRRLATDESITAAHFDWTLVPVESRTARFGELPVAGIRRKLRRRRGPADDPFAGSSGLVRFALLGCGDVGAANAQAVLRAPNARLVRCHDPVHELAVEIGARFGAEAVSTVEEALDPASVDAVVLAVPHHLHAPLALSAFDHGLHVLVEKPLAERLEPAQTMVEEARRRGLALSICFPMRYRPHVLTARRLVAADALGEPTGGLITFLVDKPPSYWVGGYSGRSVSSWRGSKLQAGGGVLITNLSHFLDLLRFVTGRDIDLVTAATATPVAEDAVERCVSFTAWLTGGALVTVFGADAARAEDATDFRLWGDAGHVRLEPQALAYTERAGTEIPTGSWTRLDDVARVDLRAVCVSRFATAVAEGGEPEISAADGLAVQAAIEAAYRSAELGVPVRPDELLVVAS